MPKKMNPESAMTILEHEDRLVSSATKWWVEKAPNGYRYYCIHSKPLTEPCDKCVRRVMRFEKAA